MFGFLAVFAYHRQRCRAVRYYALHRLLHSLQGIVTCFGPCLPLWPLQLSR